jgi:predicted NodU family carbamoyl transferase
VKLLTFQGKQRKSSVQKPLIGIGFHEDHNAGIAAVLQGEVIAYCEFERQTRTKNHIGWEPDIAAKILDSLPINSIGAISSPRPELVSDLFRDRYDGRTRNDGNLEVDDHVIKIISQDDIHPLLHLLSSLVLPEVIPAVYIVIVFDAAQPQIGWVDLTESLSGLPSCSLATNPTRQWYVGNIFATFFGKMFYSSSNLEFCGKLMGLASWGTESLSHVNALREMAENYFDSSGPLWEGYCKADPERILEDTLRSFKTNPRNHNERKTLDLAASAQELFRNELVEQVERDIEKVFEEIKKLKKPAPRAILYTGGCALSVVTNEAISKITDLPLIIPPFSHDAGQFVGGAVHATLVCNDGTLPLGRGWSGLPIHSDGHVKIADIGKLGMLVNKTTSAEVASRIVSGELIACVMGGSEAGPRALGNRSILANAIDPFVRDRLNNIVKKREWYRPFSPMVQEEVFPDYFDRSATLPARYMLDAFSIKPALKGLLAAVSSPDGLARAQSISAEQSPWLHQLLHELGKISGHPIVLNTSLNTPGRPIAYDLHQVVEDSRSLGLSAIVFPTEGDKTSTEALVVELKS